MPAAIGSKAFDPAAHLEKQGWKGKGTALKNGHLTRPLAVVHKKCLGGVGKNRDEQVPFWDNIFAATAASLSLPSSLAASPSPGPAGISGSGASTPTHRLADPRINKLGSWQTSGSAEASASNTNKGRAGLSIATRVAQENARRGLYSRFFKGEVLRSGPEDGTMDGQKKTAAVVTSVTVSTTSTPALASSSKASTPPVIAAPIERERGETKEERRARRAAKAARKAEKAEKKERREARAKRKAARDGDGDGNGDDTPVGGSASAEASGDESGIAIPIEGVPDTCRSAEAATSDAGTDRSLEDKPAERVEEGEDERRARKKRRKEEKRAQAQVSASVIAV